MLHTCVRLSLRDLILSLCCVAILMQTLHKLTARAIIRDWEEGALHPNPLEHEVQSLRYIAIIY